MQLTDSFLLDMKGSRAAARFFWRFPLIVLDHVVKEFNTDVGKVHAVRDASLEIADGEIFGIIGYSGAGKSTLVRCINLLERPDSGRVFVNGTELTAVDERTLRKERRKIGMIFQHFNLLKTRTIAGNVAYPLRKSGLSKAEKAKKVQDLLELVGIGEKANAYPSELSGGQKQRAAIARALANDPSILLCDEATSALDPRATKAILDLLKDLNAKLGLTVVVISHEMAVVKDLCDRIAVMEDGNIVEVGDVFTIFANPQSKAAKRFISSSSNLRKIDRILAENGPIQGLKPGERIIRLQYQRKDVSEPLISTISRRFNVDLNIIFADVELVDGAPIGGTVAIYNGSDETLEKIREYLAERQVKLEVLENGTV